MIEVLISSKTRIKLMLRLYLNKHIEAHLRGLEQEFGESSNSIRVELNRFEQAGLLVSSMRGNKKYYRANQSHPLFQEIHNLLLKHTRIDQVIENVISKLGDVEQVFLSGRLVKGLESKIIDLILVGNINRPFLLELVERTEEMIDRKIRYLICDPENFNIEDFTEDEVKPLLIWQKA